MSEDEKDRVRVERRLTAERTLTTYEMTREQAELEKKLPAEFQDALKEIEFCFRWLAGDLSYVCNMRGYGEIGGGPESNATDRALFLLPFYKNWRKRINHGYADWFSVVYEVCLEGRGLKTCAFKLGYSDPNQVGGLLMRALNEYCSIRGWGDILGLYNEHLDYSYLYVMGTKNGVNKIGFSDKPHERLNSHQVSNPEKIKLKYLYRGDRSRITALEKELHDHFEEKNIRGEWFNISSTEVADVCKILFPKGVEVDVKNFLDRNARK